MLSNYFRKFYEFVCLAGSFLRLSRLCNVFPDIECYPIDIVDDIM